MRRHWRWRVGLAVGVFAGLEIGGARLGFDPDPLRLLLVVALAVLLTGVLVDTVPDRRPVWEVPPPHRPLAQRGVDERTAAYLRLLESHLSARHPDTALRDRLAALAEQVLRVRYDVAWGTPAARARLGEDLWRVLTGPPRRFSGADLDRALRRIESL